MNGYLFWVIPYLIHLLEIAYFDDHKQISDTENYLQFK